VRDRGTVSGREDELKIRTAFEGGTFVIALYGDVDLANAHQVDDALLRAEATDAREIVLDLGGLHFMDSSGVHVLMAADARDRANGRRLSLLRGNADVHRVIEICALTNRLPFAG
jgi:anti-anti-sigma factor